MKKSENIKILIYGAGVIGSLYAALFAEAGFHVTVYARGQRLETLRTKGLLYKKDGKIEKAAVHVVDRMQADDLYHFIFLTVQRSQVKTALEELRENKSPTIVTMANTISDYSDWAPLCGKGRILPAFPGAGGGIEDDVLDAGLTPRIVQPTTFGEIGGAKSSRVHLLAWILRESRIPFQIVSNMHYWQVSHLALVVPIGDLYIHSAEPDLIYQDTPALRKAAEEMKSAFQFLAERGMLSPGKFHLIRLCPTPVMIPLLRYVMHSDFGDRFIMKHAAKGTEEMQQLHDDLYGWMKALE